MLGRESAFCGAKGFCPLSEAITTASKMEITDVVDLNLMLEV
jgi:hypothetical protein